MPTQGMLFDFEKPQRACIWMKGMNLNIDIVWIDHNKKVTQIKENVSPDTYPKSFCADQTRYVIELAAGTARRAGLKTGLRLKI